MSSGDGDWLGDGEDAGIVRSEGSAGVGYEGFRRLWLLLRSGSGPCRREGNDSVGNRGDETGQGRSLNI